MPAVLRASGFRVVIYLPPREHEPPHVHVWKGGAEVVIELATADAPQALRVISGMRTPDVVRAFRLVEAHADHRLHCWRRYHG